MNIDLFGKMRGAPSAIIHKCKFRGVWQVLHYDENNVRTIFYEPAHDTLSEVCAFVEKTFRDVQIGVRSSIIGGNAQATHGDVVWIKLAFSDRRRVA